MTWRASERDPLDWLGAPLKVADRTFGVVGVQSYAPKARLEEADKQVLTFVSQQLAIAIERKRNEEALRQSESRYRSLVDSAIYGIYRCDLDGKFLDVNPALVAMLGYDSAQKSWHSIRRKMSFSATANRLVSCAIFSAGFA